MLMRALALVTCLLALAACGGKQAETTPGQALASVNGVEITVMQLNDELARAGVKAASEQVAGKQLLQALIDRQLLQAEAAREKIDRDPKVMQAIERARALIVAQAWLAKRVGNLVQPTGAEIEAYYNANPQFFGARKQFSMDQVQLPAGALTADLKRVVDRATALADVTGWLEANKVAATRSHVTRSTADLAPALASKLLAMRQGQVFAVQDGERALVIALREVQDAPVTLAVARPQIAQFLIKQRQKESATTELARLRADAKITYLNPDFADAPAAGKQAANAPANRSATPAPLRSDAPPNTAANAANAALDRGVAGLK
jgi:peptidyl-prolyl cis-trans isomerase C